MVFVGGWFWFFVCLLLCVVLLCITSFLGLCFGLLFGFRCGWGFCLGCAGCDKQMQGQHGLGEVALP